MEEEGGRESAAEVATEPEADDETDPEARTEPEPDPEPDPEAGAESEELCSLSRYACTRAVPRASREEPQADRKHVERRG